MTCFDIKDAKKHDAESNKSLTQRMLIVIGTVLFVSFIMVGSASASIATDLANFSEIIGNDSQGYTYFLTNMMSVFMKPPLVYFVVLGIFVTIISIVAGLIMRRGRRR